MLGFHCMGQIPTKAQRKEASKENRKNEGSQQ